VPSFRHVKPNNQPRNQNEIENHQFRSSTVIPPVALRRPRPRHAPAGGHDARAAFGAVPSSGGFIVNNGANLVFTIKSSGDMSSCKYKGTELNDTSKASCIASGSRTRPRLRNAFDDDHLAVGVRRSRD